MSIKNNAIQGLKPRDKPYRVAVGNSLFLLVTPNGSKLWQYRYRFEGRVNILSFGPYPFVTLLQARIQRDAARLKLIQGINPVRKKNLQSGSARLLNSGSKQMRLTLQSLGQKLLLAKSESIWIRTFCQRWENDQ